MDATEEELTVTKELFFEKYKDKINNNEYHPKDIERIRADNEWVRAFYKHGFKDANRTVDIMNESLTWRKKVNANDFLIPGKLPFDDAILNKGYVFYKSEDKKGQPLLIFRSKLYKKNEFSFENVSMFLAYLLEKEYQFSLRHRVVILFDMSDSGYSNTDYDFTKFLVSCLKVYYTGLIDYVIVYSMPFIFQAIWSMVKTLIPAAAVSIVKFVDTKGIKEFIDDDKLFVHMGGKLLYTYDPKDPDLFQRVSKIPAINQQAKSAEEVTPPEAVSATESGRATEAVSVAEPGPATDAVPQIA